VLADGSEIAADLVLSNADPQRTFLDLLPADTLPAEFRERARRIKLRGTGFKINFAIAELPTSPRCPGARSGRSTPAA